MVRESVALGCGKVGIINHGCTFSRVATILVHVTMSDEQKGLLLARVLHGEGSLQHRQQQAAAARLGHWP